MKYYRVEDLNLHHVVAIVLTECRESLDCHDLRVLAAISKDFMGMFRIIVHSFEVDFTKLREPRFQL
jgi:hypothetical protein